MQAERGLGLWVCGFSLAIGAKLGLARFLVVI